MSPKPALDLAAQVTLIAWTMREALNRDEVASLLQRALSLAGVRDIQVLKKRKNQGKSVRGVAPAYPRGSVKDVDALSLAFEQLQYPAAIAPAGRVLATGPGWSMPTADSAADLEISDL